jgi:hypothetical protein
MLSNTLKLLLSTPKGDCAEDGILSQAVRRVVPPPYEGETYDTRVQLIERGFPTLTSEDKV